MGMIEEKLSEISHIDELLKIKGIGMKTVSEFITETSYFLTRCREISMLTAHLAEIET